MDKNGIVVEMAEWLLANPEAEVVEGKSTGRGRPVTRFKFGKYDISTAQMAMVNSYLDKVALKGMVPRKPNMTEAEFMEYARDAMPKLLERAINLAMGSDSIRDVMAVANMMAERGYGKAVQAVQVNVGPDVRGAWAALEAVDPVALPSPVAEAEVIPDDWRDIGNGAESDIGAANG